MAETTINTLLLDLDGTLIESGPMIRKVLEILFEKYHQDEFTEDLLTEFRGIPARDVFRYIHPTNLSEIVQEGVRLEEQYRHLAPVFPGVQKMIAACAELGIQLGVVTSQVWEEMESVRSHYDFAPLIDVWVCSDDVEKPKPDPVAVNKALVLLEAENHTTLFIGDTEYDLSAGKQAGVLTGLALWSRKNAEQKPSPCDADFVFTHPDQVSRLVARLNGISPDA
jgi:pyrophosphatase PpaX